MKNSEKVSQPISVGPKLSYDVFVNLVLHTSDKTAPINQNYIRGNQSFFTNKNIITTIMTITRLRNRFLKEATRTLNNEETRLQKQGIYLINA